MLLLLTSYLVKIVIKKKLNPKKREPYTFKKLI